MTVANYVFPNTKTFHAYDLNIASCDDCKVCHYKVKCQHKDDFEIVLNTLKTITHLVIVSPVYFGALSDQLLRILNRFQFLFEAKYTHQAPVIKIPKLTLIASAASKEDWMFDGVKLSFKLLISLFDSTEVHTLCLGNTDALKDILKTYKTEIDNLKKSVNP